MCVNLRTKYQTPSITLTSFRRGDLPPPPLQNKPIKTKKPPRLGLTNCVFVFFLQMVR